MPVHPFDCPHCGTENVSFELLGARKIPSPSNTPALLGEPHPRVLKFDDGRMPESLNSLYTTLWVCQKCFGGLGATVWFSDFGQDVVEFNATFQRTNKDIIATYPKVKKPNAPAYTPENIANYYVQGKDNYRRQNFDACGIMMRKVIEVTTKHFGYDDPKDSLYRRIEKMHTAGKVTADMAAWAHQIRDIGNKAAHDEAPFSKPDAGDISNFTELFLMYLFTLPGMMDARRTSSTP